MKVNKDDKKDIVQKVATILTQCIEFAPDKALRDNKKIPMLNEVIEEEDENDSQSDGQNQDDVSILTNLTKLKQKSS